MTVYYSLEHVLTLWYYALLVCLGFHGWNDLTIYMYINLKYNGGMHFTNCFIVVDISSSENHTMTSVTTWWQWFQTNAHCTNTNWPHWRQTDRLCWRHCSRYRLITRAHSLAWCSYSITAVILLKVLCIFFLSFHHQVNVGVIYFLHLIQFLKILRFFGVKEEGPFN